MKGFFLIASREYEQDCFIVWLINMIDSNDELLSKCSKDFLYLLLSKKWFEGDKISIINCLRQYEIIDNQATIILDIIIILCVNGEKNIIVIEDKVNSKINNNFKEYKRLIEKEIANNDSIICGVNKKNIHYICLKTGDESSNDNKIEIFKLISKKTLIRFFSNYLDIKNDIYIDFINSKFGFNIQELPRIKWNRNYLDVLLILLEKYFQNISLIDKKFQFTIKDNLLLELEIVSICSSTGQKWRVISDNDKIINWNKSKLFKKRKGKNNIIGYDKKEERKNNTIENYNDLKQFIDKYLEDFNSIVKKGDMYEKE